jgi:hypothetical protein
MKKREHHKKLMSLKWTIRTKISETYNRGINEFKKGYQPTTNIVKDKNGDLLADSRSILNRQKNYFCQLLNIHGVNDVTQMEMHTAEPLVPTHSSFKVEITTEKLKRYKSPGTDQILAELIQAGSSTLCSEIHKLINSTWNKEKLPQQCKDSIIVPIYEKVDKTNYSNYSGISMLPSR